MKKKKQCPPSICWEFPRHVPTLDFFEGMDLDKPGRLAEFVDLFISYFEQGTFLTWEAVVAQEQGLPLTRRQEEMLDGLISFGDSGDEEILYLNEIPRPSEPWHVILNRIAPHLLVEPFRTYEAQWDVTSEGWGRLVKCLEEHGEGLSLPAGAARPLDVVPPELRHELALQSCFTKLEGIGQDRVPTLEEERERVDRFIGCLRTCKEDVAYLELTLDSLFQRLVLPDRDGQFLVKAIKEALGISSTKDRIADYL